MAQDLSVKRVTVASAAVDACTRLYDAWNDLNRLADIETVGIGAFVDADFTTAPNQHLSAALVTALLQQVVPALTAAGTTPMNGTTIKTVLLQMRRG